MITLCKIIVPLSSEQNFLVRNARYTNPRNTRRSSSSSKISRISRISDSPAERKRCIKSHARRCPTKQNVESTSETPQVVANSLEATTSKPEDPSDQVQVADDSSSIVPPDRSIQLQADDSTRRGTLQLQHSGSEQNHTASDTGSISDESSDCATYRRLLKKF